MIAINPTLKAMIRSAMNAPAYYEGHNFRSRFTVYRGALHLARLLPRNIPLPYSVECNAGGVVAFCWKKDGKYFGLLLFTLNKGRKMLNLRKKDEAGMLDCLPDSQIDLQKEINEFFGTSHATV